jgi:hypothetical protein
MDLKEKCGLSRCSMFRKETVDLGAKEESPEDTVGQGRTVLCMG